MIEKYSSKQKIKAFDFLVSKYFEAGFGSMSKSDVDQLFFNVATQYSNITDHSDYILSKLLKITQPRVRNLKLKNGLKYNQLSTDAALKQFEKYAKFARLEDDNKRISIPIYDPNVFVELENLIEQSHGYVELQLNPKILTIRIDQFLNLLIQLEIKRTGQHQKDIEDKYFSALKDTILKEVKATGKVKSESILSIKDVQKIFLETGVGFGFEMLLSAIPMAKPILGIVQVLSKSIQR
jgi:hypothetical protein